MAVDRPPLEGITLKKMLEDLQAHYGWDEMGIRVPVRCFNENPSLNSSLTFLRRTPWARLKVEQMYLDYLQEIKRGT